MTNDLVNLPGYSIIRKIGTGARTVIYLANQESDNTQIALKRAVFETDEDERIFEQMKTEHTVANKIDDPYIRKTYKIIRRRKKIVKVNEMYMVMEYVDGKPLEDCHSLSLVDILLIFRMAAVGLRSMHTSGFVHCDIKPNNILLLPNGYVKIIDLGQSCEIGTIKKRVQGTPDYIAPEQVRKLPLGPKTDVFNLGATMYWALTGKNVPTLINQHSDLGSVARQRQYLAPHQIYKQIPLGISNFVMQCVREEMQERPATMNEFISRLETFIHSIMSKRKARNG
jgi:eukaryotic-like serine/threonine-protein kinase